MAWLLASETTSMPAAAIESAASGGARNLKCLAAGVPRAEIVHSTLAKTRSASPNVSTTPCHGASGPSLTIRRPIVWASITSPTAISRTLAAGGGSVGGAPGEEVAWADGEATADGDAAGAFRDAV